MDDNRDSHGSETVPALRRAVQILDYVSSAEAEPNATELARALSIPKSTAHGLLTAMVDLGLLTRSQDGLFHLGPHLMRWADSFLARQDIVAEFQRHFAESSDLAEHTVTLTVLMGARSCMLVVVTAGRRSASPFASACAFPPSSPRRARRNSALRTASWKRYTGITGRSR